MDEISREKLESAVRGQCDAGDYDGAATAAIRGYGPELLGFLVAVSRDPDEGNEIFSDVAEALWHGLPTFGWNSTLRTWSYAIARNISRSRRRGAARQARRAPRASASALSDIAQAVRTETLAYLKTQKRTRLEALRDSLEPGDRMLLVLRVDRQLSWRDLAVVMWDDPAPPNEQALTRESARLRKRFQIIKDRLRELARKEGLIE